MISFRPEDMDYFYRNLLVRGYDNAARGGWEEMYMRAMNTGPSGGYTETALRAARRRDYWFRWISRLASMQMRDRAAHDALLARVAESIEADVETLEAPPLVR